ncbi:hypothetical protein L6164_002883 [Bauhinia variegata]|uniref:Uncharacterized protein n=1 Tax=Bauhinia variegata TaxID=167791 RepID=A0ACB9PZN3_BAUVA|nr:hypothetical protein L6164_002883 [Bauhinia variegata]
MEIDEASCDFHKMRKPQRDLEKGDWESLMKFFQEHKKAVLESFDFSANTVIYRVAALKKSQILRNLLDMLSPRDQWHALRIKNVHGNTILHNGELSVEIAKIILEYEKELPRPMGKQIYPQQQEKKYLPLLEIRNAKGETPIYRAALDGNLKLLKYFTNQVVDLKMHYHRNQDKLSILHASVSAGYFAVALWLLKMDSALANEKDDNGCTCLQLLSTMPIVFRSGTTFGAIEKLIYKFLPEFPYNVDDDDDNNIMVRDIETGENIRKHHISVLSRINSTIWKWLAEGWDAIEIICTIKMINKLAAVLADVLVQKDNSWKKSFHYKQRPTKVSTATFSPSNVSSEPDRDKQYTPSDSDYTPLLLAAAKGIVEIVERILELYPEAINHVSKDELNILHVAVIYRQKKIYQIVKKYEACKALSHRLASNGNSVLHQVGSMKFYRGTHEAGIAYQLQEELHWFHERNL